MSFYLYQASSRDWRLLIKPEFRGELFQDGHGLGSLFGSVIRKVVPLFKQQVVPTLKTSGKTLL